MAPGRLKEILQRKETESVNKKHEQKEEETDGKQGQEDSDRTTGDHFKNLLISLSVITYQW